MTLQNDHSFSPGHIRRTFPPSESSPRTKMSAFRLVSSRFSSSRATVFIVLRHRKIFRCMGLQRKGSERTVTDQLEQKNLTNILNHLLLSPENAAWQYVRSRLCVRQSCSGFNPLKGRDVNWLHLAVQI